MKVLSLGAGVQSSTMLLLYLHGELERPELGWNAKAYTKNEGAMCCKVKSITKLGRGSK